MADFDVVVLGAGVVGLASAAALASAGLKTMIVDGERSFGTWTSSRNSEVVHAGIYYNGTPLKAELCVRGRHLMYRYCETFGVPHRRIGKLIFAATPDQAATLDTIEENALAAGVEDLRRLTSAEARALEPELDCAQALLSPSTGIVDSHAFMLSLLGFAESRGAEFCGSTRVTALSRQPEGWGVHLEGEEEPTVVARRVVNAAGLTAHAVAAATEGLDPRHVPKVRYARGHYFAYSGAMPFSRLIYPVPVPGGLGTHLTFDMAGAARFGPDVEWIDEIAYGVDAGRKVSFVEAARKIWSAIDPEKMAPAYSGIRAKLSGPGEAAADFRIDGPEAHGLDGLVNLFGIESPGLTSSLAIAASVSRKLGIEERDAPFWM
ncbi:MULTISPECIES: NAD(P)/FAD-dependent oxidoreductase [unclassified Aureimonas]|uniref:NAD(P)/FAD-dependent oxidoreductase n=1 Tax=unclassified Aureimonas TaxID=2615206 RepID=UPI0006F3DD47|nr:MULTISPECIES: NAD(P)/FAD-dependent oxidoreductase [unclassified Aureimonas]KQT60471.1 FAD-dependent oxidoreductase [Aureimonas sp. Leaf427]KQT79348.1 FAD-dependent oxidoreductase [Aureimonas sp. Leaf460]